MTDNKEIREANPVMSKSVQRRLAVQLGDKEKALEAITYTESKGMIFIGLLTSTQKQAGYFVSQDEDFIYLFHRADGNPRIVAIFLYEIATVKEIRDSANKDMKSPRIKGLL